METIMEKGRNQENEVMTDYSALPDSTQVAFMAFKDWLSEREHESEGWIVVARQWREGQTELFTTSALVQAGKDSTQQILRTHEWGIPMLFGLPGFETHSAGQEDGPATRYDPGTRLRRNTLEFRPFVLMRSFYDYMPWRFELIQEFLLYHEAFLEKEDSD